MGYARVLKKSIPQLVSVAEMDNPDENDIATRDSYTHTGFDKNAETEGKINMFFISVLACYRMSQLKYY